VRVGRGAATGADDGTPSDVAGGYVDAGIACIERTDVRRGSRLVSAASRRQNSRSLASFVFAASRWQSSASR